MFSITIVYMLVNIAYYAVVDKQEILGSGRIIAALFFGKVWGIWTERVSQSCDYPGHDVEAYVLCLGVEHYCGNLLHG